MTDYLTQRLNMVESQVRANDVTDVRIQEAMKEIPRERFVPHARRALAYADRPVEVTAGRYLLDPRTVSKLAQLATIAPGDRILDVACASGYSTVMLARLGAIVTALEEDAELVRIASDTLRSMGTAARVVQGQLSEGHSAGAPYDVIFINGAIEFLPKALEAQMAEGGRLVVVIQKGAQGRANLFLKEHGRVGNRADFDATLPVLPGFSRPRGFVF